MKRLFAVLGPHVEDGATIMLLLFLCVAVAIFFVYAALAAFHPYPLDCGEAPLVDQAMRLAAGQPNTSNAPTTR